MNAGEGAKLLGADEDRVEGWKAIAAAIGVSLSRARELADPRRKFQLPVRYGARGVYVARAVLATWFTHFDAPYGAHGDLKRSPGSGAKSRVRREVASPTRQ